MRSSLYNSIREVDPLENGGDDWPRLMAFAAEWADKAAIYLRPGTWRCGTKVTVPNHSVFIGSPGVRIIQGLVYGGVDPENAAFGRDVTLTGVGDTTLAANAVPGSVTVSAVASVSAGTLVRVSTAGYVQIYTVVSVAGVGPFTLTLDRVVKYAFPLGSAVAILTDQPTDIHIIGDGMSISGTGDRYISLSGALDCSIEGVNFDAADGNLGATGVTAAFSSGGRNCELKNLRCNHQGAAPAPSGGFYITSAESCQGQACYSQVAGTIGLAVLNSFDCSVTESSSVGCAYGAYIGDSFDCEVSSCTLTGNTLAGLVVSGGERSRVSLVDASYNTTYGIELTTAAAQTNLTDISCKGNGGFGLAVTAGVEDTKGTGWTLTQNGTNDLRLIAATEASNIYLAPTISLTSLYVDTGASKLFDVTIEDQPGSGSNLVHIAAGASLRIDGGRVSGGPANAFYNLGTLQLMNVTETGSTNAYNGQANSVFHHDEFCSFGGVISLPIASALATASIGSIVELEPIGGGVDDWPHLKKAMDTYAGTKALLLKPGTWTCNSKQEMPSNTVIIGGPGVIINQTLVYSGGADPFNAAFYAAPVTTATTTTLAANVTVGTRTIVTNANIAPGTIIRISWAASTLRSLYYTVISSGGGGGPTYTLTLDRPILENFLTNDVVTNQTSRPTNIRILGNGMKITGTGDRYIEFAAALQCSVSDVIMDNSIGVVGALGAGASFDIGCQECAFQNVSIRYGGTINNGLMLESAERCKMTNCTAEDVGVIGIAMWDDWNCVVDSCSAYGNTYGIYLGTDSLTVGCKDCVVTTSHGYSNSDTGISINGPSLRTKISNCSANYNTTTGISINVAGTDNTSIENVSCVGNASGLRVSGTTTNTKGSDWALLNNTTQDLYIQGQVDASKVYCSGAGTQNVLLSGANAIARISDLNVLGTQGVASNIVLLETNATGYFDRPVIRATTAGSSLFANNTGSTLYIHDADANQAAMTGVAGYINSTTRISGDMLTNIFAAVGTAHFNFGTVALNGAAAVAVAFRGMRTNDHPNLTLVTVAGVLGLTPAVAITAGTGFTVTGQAGDTSTYRYNIGD